MLFRIIRGDNSSSQEISKVYLGNHQCLALEEVPQNSLGGPTNAEDDKKCKILMLL